MYLLSSVVALLLFALGVVLWRLQLFAKRHFEVAEQALTAFYKASDAISMLRNPIIRAEEQASIELPKDLSKDDQDRLRLYNVYTGRAQAGASDFSELRTAQIVARVHFGQATADIMNVLFRARWEVMYAARELQLGAAV